jgi:parvulin-like peptidyl-prolyl isomerase
MNDNAASPPRALLLARILLLFAIAAAAGLLVGELLARRASIRAAIAGALGRGELVAITRGVGVYSRGAEEADVEPLVMAENLRQLSRDQSVTEEQITREEELLRYQFGDEKVFTETLKSGGTSEAELRDHLATHLRGLQWLEGQIPPQLAVPEEEIRQYFEQHGAVFAQPLRYRATHLFLAAPEGSPDQIVKAKEQAIRRFAARIAKGEPLAQLAIAASEDEATKRSGGDLGYFAADRVPEEFIAEIGKLRVGQISAPIRSHLGFHIVQLTDVKPSRLMTFGEVRAEIALKLANEKRAAAVEQLAESLAGAEFIRTAQ